jgi:REP element-mobilizing transposase RayT
MDNHYHLLVETQKENLSTCMRIVNANYAPYFNKRYQRSGHLWQDRYKSKYITSEEYLDGYTQASIATYLGVSKSLVSKVIKSGDSTPRV